VKLATLQARGFEIAEQAKESRKARIMSRLNLTPGIDAQISAGGIEITGKGLIHRFVTDNNFRNSIS